MSHPMQPDMPVPQPAQRPTVVVIGCGFAGLAAVRRLSRHAVDIVLIDRTNHHLFQPLLYQVATAGLAAPSIAEPIRHVLRRETARGNLTILLGDVTGIATERRQVLLDDHEPIRYDHLLVASGVAHSYFGNDQWAGSAPGLKTLNDAFDLRSRILLAFEKAERSSEPIQQQDQLTFVVIGAGPTGVEMAGTMIEIARRTLHSEYRRIDPGSARVVLIEGQSRVLGAFSAKASEAAKRQLEALGVELRLGCRVMHVDADGVRCVGPDGQSERIDAKTVVWAAGVAASPLGRMLHDSAGAVLDSAGRVVVEPDLSVRGAPGVSVIGDLAAAMSHRDPVTPTPVPGLSPAAKQMGDWAAVNVLRRIDGETPLPFWYRDHGALATIGRRAAVAEVNLPLLGRCLLHGYPAWLFWLFVHIYFLIGFRNRVVVLADWMSAYWTARRSARVIAMPPYRSASTAASNR